ncbi:TIR domain-containing protein [Nonlabens sp. Asnod2-A12]|uniref:TIR domain-containing protein n=1 Tax=Nonlabens sp. Asnod2-A12 TaxID=3160578 RepID=UPI0038704FF3
MAKDYKIFISHSWAHTDELEALQNLLNARGYFKVEFMEASKNVPINSQSAPYVKSVLKQKILNSDIILGLAGIYASHSEWMIWELETAKKNNIPIVGVIPRGRERISSEVYSRSIVDVKWNTESIIAAIRSYAK